VHRHDHGPSAFAWLIALISLALPWAGAGLALFGIWHITRSEQAGWWYLIAGGSMLVADVLIDLVWAHPQISKSDQPELNQRALQLVGRVLVVEEPIEHGRGKVRVGDTLWSVEGPDAPVGAHVRVAAAHGTVLRVEPA
jgi:inner membrane protein